MEGWEGVERIVNRERWKTAHGYVLFWQGLELLEWKIWEIGVKWLWIGKWADHEWSYMPYKVAGQGCRVYKLGLCLTSSYLIKEGFLFSLYKRAYLLPVGLASQKQSDNCLRLFFFYCAIPTMWPLSPNLLSHGYLRVAPAPGFCLHSIGERKERKNFTFNILKPDL